MKTKQLIGRCLMALAFAVAWIGIAARGHAQTVLLQDGFDGASGDTNPTLYGFNSNSGGTAPTVATEPGATGLSGKGLMFSGSGNNSGVAADFTPVTLANPGDSITFSFQYSNTALPQGGTLQIGLLNSGGTALTGGMFGVAGNSYDDAGYLVTKNVGSGLTTGDVLIKKETATAGGSATVAGGVESPTTASLQTSSSGVSGYTADTVNNTVNTVSLTLTLAANGTDLDLAYTLDGVTITETLTGSNVVTKTFDEITLAPGSGSNAAPYVDNLLVTTTVAVPEPSSVALLVLGALGVAWGARQGRPARRSLA